MVEQMLNVTSSFFFLEVTFTFQRSDQDVRRVSALLVERSEEPAGLLSCLCAAFVMLPSSLPL